jgi:hypothetical protein
MLRHQIAGLAIIASSLAASACDSDTSGPEDAGFELAVTSPTGATLGTTQTIDVDITSSDYAGTVTLNLTGAPADWVISFLPSATPTIAAGGTTDVTVQITIPSNGTPAPSGQSLAVEASGTSGDVTENTSLVVANEYVLHVVGGFGAHWGAAAGTTIDLKAGTLLRIVNDHSVTHTIHTTGAIGMPHQPDPGMATGQSYTSTVTAGAEDLFCHIHGPIADDVRIQVTS